MSSRFFSRSTWVTILTRTASFAKSVQMKIILKLFSGNMYSMASKSHFRSRGLFHICLIGLLLAAVTDDAWAATNAYSQAMRDRDTKAMSSARKKRAEILSKRHDMNDKQSRAAIVRDLKEANDTHEAADSSHGGRSGKLRAGLQIRLGPHEHASGCRCN